VSAEPSDSCCPHALPRSAGEGIDRTASSVGVGAASWLELEDTA
jgi:hypothetical protein